MLELEVLISETIAVDRRTTGAVTACKVTALDHKVLDYTMELGALVALAFLTSHGQLSEVLNSLGHNVAEETDDDTTGRLVSDFDIKKDLLGHQRRLFELCLSIRLIDN
jgi:hypothetical protein